MPIFLPARTICWYFYDAVRSLYSAQNFFCGKLKGMNNIDNGKSHNGITALVMAIDNGHFYTRRRIILQDG